MPTFRKGTHVWCLRTDVPSGEVTAVVSRNDYDRPVHLPSKHCVYTLGYCSCGSWPRKRLCREVEVTAESVNDCYGGVVEPCSAFSGEKQPYVHIISKAQGTWQEREWRNVRAGEKSGVLGNCVLGELCARGTTGCFCLGTA